MDSLTEVKTYALFAHPASRKLIASLEQSGAKVFQFAPVKTQKFSFEENIEFINNHFSEFDWIIFPDIFTVDYFLEILERSEIELFELDKLNVLAMGEAIADRLRFAQLHADIIPHSVDTETVFSTLRDYFGEVKFSEQKFLILNKSDSDGNLKEKLIGAGAAVTEIRVYEAEISEKNNITNLKALLSGGAIDEFVFSSPEDVLSFKLYLSSEKLSECFFETKASGIDEITTQILRENNLQPKIFQKKEAEKLISTSFKLNLIKD